MIMPDYSMILVIFQGNVFTMILVWFYSYKNKVSLFKPYLEKRTNYV